MKGSSCKTSYDCRNEYVCYDGKCTDYFKLTGTDYNIKKVADLGANYLCEYGESNAAGTSCVKPDYSPNFASKANIDGLVKCTLGSRCEYNDGFTTFTSDCKCGLNENGIGYCDKPKARCNYYLIFRDKCMEHVHSKYIRKY